MSDLIQQLIVQRAKVKQDIEALSRKLNVIESMIIEARENKGLLKNAEPTTKAVDSVFFMQKIRDLLLDHKLGMTTKDLHHNIRVFFKKDMNYNTFRSYLNRMKQKEEIYQDQKKRWHLKD